MRSMRTLGFAGAIAALGLPAVAALTSETDIPFRVRMGESPIGMHSVAFEQRGDETHVFVTIAFDVGVAFITLYEYEHRNHEVWRDGRLIRIETETNDDGDRYTLTGEATAEGFRFIGSEGEGLAPAGVAPTSYWSRALLEAPAFLDTQKGRLLDLTVAPQGRGAVAALNGDEIAACAYSITGDLDLTVWYDDADRWVKMAFSLNGNDFDYEILRPAQAPVVLAAARPGCAG